MQATIYKISPFDASVGTTIKFSWNGNQVFKNRCIIKENKTGETVYDKTIESFKLEHTLDLTKASLLNGEWYNAFLSVFDKNGNESDIQQLGQAFICLKTPVFKFENLIDNQSISSSSYEFILDYSQENDELLDSWSISVYTKNHSLLSTSGIKYDTENLKYVISGFTNKNEYIVRAVGQTVNGFALDTGDINISISYSTSSIFSKLEPTNIREIGAIQVKANIISSEGHLKKEPGIYIDNEYLDLRDNTVTYSEGFLFDGDFSIALLCYGLNPNKQLLKLYDDTRRFEAVVTYRVIKAYPTNSIPEDMIELDGGTALSENIEYDVEDYDGGNAFVAANEYEYEIDGDFASNMLSIFELMVTSNGYKSVYYSNKIPFLSSADKAGFCVTRQNNLYELEIALLDKG